MLTETETLIRELTYINTNKSRAFLDLIHDVTQRMRAQTYVNSFFNNPKYIRDRKWYVASQLQRLVDAKVPHETLEKYDLIGKDLLNINDVIQVTLGPDRKLKRDIDFEIIQFQRQRFVRPERIRAELLTRIKGLRDRPYPIIAENVGLPGRRWLGVNPITLIQLVEMNARMLSDVMLVDNPEFIPRFDKLLEEINLQCSGSDVLNIEKASTIANLINDNQLKSGNSERAPLGHTLEQMIGSLAVTARRITSALHETASQSLIASLDFNLEEHIRATNELLGWVRYCYLNGNQQSLHHIGMKPYWFWLLAHDLLQMAEEARAKLPR